MNRRQWRPIPAVIEANRAARNAQPGALYGAPLVLCGDDDCTGHPPADVHAEPVECDDPVPEVDR